MTDPGYGYNERDERSAQRHSEDQTLLAGRQREGGNQGEEWALSRPSLLGRPALSSHTNAIMHAQTMLGAQRTHGNHSVQRVVQRSTTPHSSHTSSPTIHIQRAYDQDGRYIADDYPGGQKKYDENFGAAKSSFFWDVAGMTGIGGVVSTGIDIAEGVYNGIQGNNGAAAQNFFNAAVDGVGSIPVVGQILGAGEAMWDYDAMGKRKDGVTPDKAPTASEALMNKFIDLVSAPEDNHSWDVHNAPGANNAEAAPAAASSNPGPVNDEEDGSLQ